MRCQLNVLLLTLSVLLAACVPAASEAETAVGVAPAAVVTVERSTSTPRSATTTPWPAVTPLPVTPTPTPLDVPSLPPPPTLPAVIDDAWVSGYIMGDQMEDCPFQVGAFSENIPRVWLSCLRLVPATDVIAAELAAVPPGDTLLQLSGSLATATTAPQDFTVAAIAYVNLPYLPQTPLDATHNSDKLGIAFDYPAGWEVVDDLTDPNTVTVSSMPPGTVHLRPGREHLDPTEYWVTVRQAGTDTLAQWQADLEALAELAPTFSQLQIGDWDVVRAEWTVYGVTVEYGVEVNGRPFVLHTNDIGEDFMARVLETLRPLVYENVMACGYNVYEDRFDVGSIDNGAIFYSLSLTPADEDAAAQLAAFPYGETFLQLHGDLIASGSHRGEMIVNSVSQITIPFTEESLTAVYAHTNPAFSFNYPEGWVLSAGNNGASLHNTPEIPGCYRPGRENMDPTHIFISVRVTDFATIDEYAEYYRNKQQSDCNEPVLESEEVVTIAGWNMTKFVLGDCPFWPYDVYAWQLGDEVVTWRTDRAGREVIPQLLETLTVP